MATTKKAPVRRKASPKVRKGSTASKTVAAPDRPRVVKTATRKAAASDPRAARVAARQRRLQDQEKAKDVRAAKKSNEEDRDPGRCAPATGGDAGAAAGQAWA